MNLVLTNNDSLQLTRSGTAAVDVHVSYVELTVSGGYQTVNSIGRQDSAFSSAATADILSTPASGFVRTPKVVFIRNKDASNANTVTLLYNANGTTYELFKIALNAGDHWIWVEGMAPAYYSALQSSLFKVLTADDTGGQAINTVQPWFPTTGSLTVPATSTFRMTGLLAITHGATTHTTGLSFGGTATLTSIDYYATCQRSAANAISTGFSGIQINTASNTVLEATSTAAATYVTVNGIIRINAAGTLIPQFTFSASPTGTITIKRNSFFRLEYLGDNTVAAQGTWA